MTRKCTSQITGNEKTSYLAGFAALLVTFLPFGQLQAAEYYNGTYASEVTYQQNSHTYIPGDFGVSNGSVGYTIPIIVPPGIAGMEPELAISVSTQGGSAAVVGLSSISRCGSTVAQDGFNRGVQFNDLDHYCLDGQRLIPVNGLPEGAEGTEYRTQFDSFTKVISHYDSANLVRWFEAWTKSGQRMEFGNTDDSRLEAQGKTQALTWGVSRIEDAVGNYLTVTYYEVSANTEMVPRRISYAGLASQTLEGNSVEIIYDALPDNGESYLQGSKIKSSKRLKQVVTYTDDPAGLFLQFPVLNWRLDYGTNAAGAPILNSVKQCAALSPDNCLPATTFGWQDDTDPNFKSVSSWNAWLTQDFSDAQLLTGDINADGYEDLLITREGVSTDFYLSDGSALNFQGAVAECTD